MHGALRPLLAHLRYARPWQRLLAAAALLLIGGALVAAGSFGGVAPVVAGALIAAPDARRLVRRRRQADGAPDSGVSGSAPICSRTRESSIPRAAASPPGSPPGPRSR